MNSRYDRLTPDAGFAMNGVSDHFDDSGLSVPEREILHRVVADAASLRLSDEAIDRLYDSSLKSLLDEPLLNALRGDAQQARQRAGLAGRVHAASVGNLWNESARALPTSPVRHERIAGRVAGAARRRGWLAMAAGLVLAFFLGLPLTTAPESPPERFVLHELLMIGDEFDHDEFEADFTIEALASSDLHEITFDEVEYELDAIESLLARR